MFDLVGSRNFGATNHLRIRNHLYKCVVVVILITI